jgi:hypothetical protein
LGAYISWSEKMKALCKQFRENAVLFQRVWAAIFTLSCS